MKSGAYIAVYLCQQGNYNTINKRDVDSSEVVTRLAKVIAGAVKRVLTTNTYYWDQIPGPLFSVRVWGSKYSNGKTQ
jgi:hypothetical protein